MKAKEEYINFRATRRQKDKLSHLTQATGLSRGAVLRALVDAVDLGAVQPLRLVMKNESADSTLTGDGAFVDTNP